MGNLKSRIVVTAMLAAVAYLAAGGMTDAWMCVGQDGPPPLPPEAGAKLQEKQAGVARKPTERLPIGLAHDFGKIKYGTFARCFLCIVNTADDPLRIVSVRASSANHLRARMSKPELQPNEEGKLEVSIDARCFVGRKIAEVWLEMESGDKSIVVRVRITAESVKEVVEEIRGQRLGR